MFYVKSLVIFKIIIFSDLIVSYVDKIEYFNISNLLVSSNHENYFNLCILTLPGSQVNVGNEWKVKILGIVVLFFLC